MQGLHGTNVHPKPLHRTSIAFVPCDRMAPSTNINYAKESGIHSVAAAAIFAVLYAFLLPYYIWRATRNPTYVLIILSLFCASKLLNIPFIGESRRLTVCF